MYPVSPKGKGVSHRIKWGVASPISSAEAKTFKIDEMKVKKAIEELTRELGRTPNRSEVESVVDDAAAVSAILATECTSLNRIVAENEELECFAGDDKTETIDYQLQCEMMLDNLRKEVSERDFNMFIFRNGLLGKKEHTLDEIASYHGVTRARVHQVTKQCFSLMKQAISV